MFNQTLDGQSVLVVGGSSGIGLASARAVAELGGRAIITGRDEARLRWAADQSNGNVTTRVLDCDDHDSFRRAVGELGPLDHLVLVPGAAGGVGPLATLDLDEVRRALAGKPLNFLAAIQAILPVLRPGGSITLVGGRAATAPAPGAAILAMVNGAVEALVPTLSIELAPTRVNAVSPAVIDTDWWSGFPPAAVARIFEAYAGVAAVGRVGQANEVAAAIMSLLTNEFLTGVVLIADGGARDPGAVFGAAAAA
jgi:NAD(P)-dependent dehydrogenase (short-subunit alcohol dehydrogenase family)